eukprot:TRINITY_DN3582_c0_g1_i1.p2 TRINITY_DN3582_c0_g1~~TRINITY_DN3582_c0_g1_i1.p2  ORF type:complete len:721 (+),score=63.46 TRINITY_DN3582_c0_g1_i1:1103-3265(+)
MNLHATFEKEYIAFCTQCSELANTQIIKLINTPHTHSADRTIHINLHNQGLNELTFMPISKALSKVGPHIISLDLSFNLLFKDCCVVHLENVLRTSTNLAYLTLEKTGITDQGGINIIKSLAMTSTIKSLNISSNKFSDKFFDRLATTFKEGKLQALEALNLSNTKMNEKHAIALFLPLIQCSNVEKLNLSMNSLRYKAGSCLITLLTTNPKSALKHVDLSYNPLSKSLLEAIEMELVKKQNEANKTITDQAEISGINPIMDTKNAFNPAIMANYGKNMEEATTTLNKFEENMKELMLEEQIPLESVEPYNEVNTEKCEQCFDPEEFAEPEYGQEEVLDPEDLEEKDVPTYRHVKEKIPAENTATFCETSNGTEGALQEVPYSTNYENIRAKILKNRANAKELHPFYARCHNNRSMKENTATWASSRSNFSEDLTKRKPNKTSATVIVEELEEDTITSNKGVKKSMDEFRTNPRDSSTAKKLYQAPDPSSNYEIEEAKNIIKSHIHKLLEFYATLDSSFGLKGDPLEAAKRLVYETQVPAETVTTRSKSTGKIASRRFSANQVGREIRGRFIRKRNDSTHLTQYSTNVSRTTYETESGLGADIGKKGIVWGGEEEKVYKEILGKAGISLRPKRFVVNNYQQRITMLQMQLLYKNVFQIQITNYKCQQQLVPMIHSKKLQPFLQHNSVAQTLINLLGEFIQQPELSVGKFFNRFQERSNFL